MSNIKILKYHAAGCWEESKSTQFMEVFDPSTGQVQALAPCCTKEEVINAIASARKAFPAWSATPAAKRVQVLYKFRELIEKNLDALTECCAREHGKTWDEAQGDILKVKEPVEFACGAPSLMLGEALMNASPGFDTVLYREPVGVFGCIVPFNFPGMIPFGWMAPLCIATGNTMVIKAASMTPMTSIFLLELMQQAGLPDGVINLVTCSRTEAQILLEHPDVNGISFVGSTQVGLNIYATASANGKRVQALCEAKNHALVLEDAILEQCASSIIGSAFGCAGERCMALPVVVVQESVADKLIMLLKSCASQLKIGPAYDKTSEMGPVVSEAQRQSIINWIETGVQEGAELVLDGRNLVVKGFEKGFYLGPTIFDHVTPDMTIGRDEIFGPVLCIKRVKDFEEGLNLINQSEFANGSVIYTQNGYYSREFAMRSDAGMVGINVGIPVPMGVFPFAGHKKSFFGDQHVLGKDGIGFYTESKVVTTRWFSENGQIVKKAGTWEGNIAPNGK